MKKIYIIMSLLGSSYCLAEKAPKVLGWDNYTAVKDYVVGDETDENYLKVDWKKTVQDGQVTSVQEDKPLLLWLYFGGPLGNC